MTKKQVIKYLQKNKGILSIRAIAIQAGFANLDKVVNGQTDKMGRLFTFPDRHLGPVTKQIKRLQTDLLKGK